MLWPVRYYLIHKRQSFQRSALHHIDNHTPHNPLYFLYICESINYSACDRATEGMTDNNHVFIGKPLHELLKSFNGFGVECLYGEVLVVLVFFGKAVPFQVESHQSAEALDLFGQSCKT